jgi:IS5 family transposase
MSRRDLSQPSFVDAMVSGYGRVGGFLDRIEKAFDWSSFEALLSSIHGSATGAPGYPPLTMFKILLLQQWHTLSDPAAEEAVRDRLSFRRFCGLPLDMETPDHASIWRFRQAIDKLGLSTKLLAEVNRQLDALGLIIKRGTLSTRPSSPAQLGVLMKAAASARATPRLVSPASATRPISATRRIWRWTRRAVSCAKPR